MTAPVATLSKEMEEVDTAASTPSGTAMTALVDIKGNRRLTWCAVVVSVGKVEGARKEETTAYGGLGQYIM